MSNITLFDRNKGKFDSINSTYRWEIFQSNNTVLDGYSKGKDLSERKDKFELLLSCMRRIFNNGYLRTRKVNNKVFSTTVIAVYKKDVLNDRKLDYHLFNIYPDPSFKIEFTEEFEKHIPHPTVIYELEKMMKLIQENKHIPEMSFKTQRVRYSKSVEDDDFDYKRNFQSINELSKYCKDFLITERKYDINRVRGYYNDVKIKQKIND
jgi:hypothetical protein